MQPFLTFMCRYEYVNRRYEGDDEIVGPATEDLDTDDIDNQLEMALLPHHKVIQKNFCFILVLSK